MNLIRCQESSEKRSKGRTLTGISYLSKGLVCLQGKLKKKMETVVHQGLQGILLLLQQRQNTHTYIKEKGNNAADSKQDPLYYTLCSFAVHLETPLKKCIRSLQYKFDINWRDMIKKCFPLLCCRIVNDARNTFKSLGEKKKKGNFCDLQKPWDVWFMLRFFVTHQTTHYVSSCSLTLLRAYGQEITRGHKYC